MHKVMQLTAVVIGVSWYKELKGVCSIGWGGVGVWVRFKHILYESF